MKGLGFEIIPAINTKYVLKLRPKMPDKLSIEIALFAPFIHFFNVGGEL